MQNVRSSPSIQRVAIIVAMEEEALPIVAKLNMVAQTLSVFGFHEKLQLGLFETTIKNKKVFLITNGKNLSHDVDRVGTQSAALTTFTVIERLKPDLIMSMGTAGGLKDSQIGDVYLSNGHFAYIDRVINLPKYKEYGIGNFNYFHIPEAAKEFNFKLGIIASGSSLDPSARDLEELKRLNADVVDMESAAIAEVAERFDIKMIAIKSVTNFINTNLHTDFEKNYSLAVSNLASKIDLFINWLLED